MFFVRNKKMSGFTLLEILLAIFLSTLLIIATDKIFITLNALYQKTQIINTIQERIRFIHFFLRGKIQMSGNWSCESDEPDQRTPIIKKLTAGDALEKWGITILPNTDLLQLRECVHTQDTMQYVPILFFAANTSRINKNKKTIPALYYKINDAPREELITDVTAFQISLSHATHHPKKITCAKINFTILNQDGIMHAAVRKNAA